MPREGQGCCPGRQRLLPPHQAPPARRRGGIIQKECPIYACKVMRVCPKCGTNPPVRPTSCWPTVKSSRLQRSAALKSERKERIYYACFEG